MNLQAIHRTGGQLIFSGRQSLNIIPMSLAEMVMRNILGPKTNSETGLGKTQLKHATFIICLNFPNISLNGRDQRGLLIFMKELCLITFSLLRILKREM